MSPRTIIFSNQKGGVGKTTLTRELGVYVANLGLKVLFVDCDPQGNLTKSLLEEECAGLYEALSDGNIQPVELDDQLSLLCGDYRLSLLEKSLIGEIDAYSRLRELFEDPIFDRYDYLFLDTPPSLGVLTINALAAARYLLIPMNPSLYSMQGTNDLLRTVSKVRSNLNADLLLIGVIINAYESIPVISRQIRAEILAAFGEKVFGTVLSKSIKLEEAIALKRGVIYHGRLEKSRAKDEVSLLGNELLSRLEGVTSREDSHGVR